MCRGDVASHEEAPSPQAEEQQLAATKALRKHLIEVLSADASPETRALGAWLAEQYAQGEAYSPYFDRLQLCKGNFECFHAVSAEGRVAVEKALRPYVDEVVKQAVDSSNASIYAMAVNVCHPVLDIAPSPSCQRISTERWTQVNPGDASPWLRLLEEAAARHDTATANEAFYRASVAGSFRASGESLLAYAEPALASGFSDADRLQIEWDLFARPGFLGLPPMYAAAQQCSEEAIEDSNRRQTCDAFTTMLLDKSTSLIHFHIGVRMAERLHWPAEQLAALRRERDALDAAPSGLFLSEQGCESARAVMDRARQRARLGEVATSRAAIAASGRSVEDFAKLSEVRREEHMKTANAASAAASD